jgi:phage terminase large subunit-like protein
MRRPPKLTIHLKKPHRHQWRVLRSPAKRKIICAGRRSGKTTVAAILAIEDFLAGKRVLYAAPTAEQLGAFWDEVTIILAPLIQAKVLVKNEAEHIIELPGTKGQIRAKTAWNANSLRGDFADLLILDEWQLMNEDAWQLVGAPMLLDNNGNVLFIYTPPSFHSQSASKARDIRHASKMFDKAKLDTTGRWEAFRFTSHDNPHISRAALDLITSDMSHMAYRQEIEAEDLDEIPGALWNRSLIEKSRVATHPDLRRIVVAIDPAVSSKDTSDEAGIMVGGVDRNGHGYLLADLSRRDSPVGWASVAIDEYRRRKADRIVAETNNGGDMVESLLRGLDPNVSYEGLHASRGKLTRAEPVSALYEKGRIHHVGLFPELEDEMCSYVPGADSPNRMDALVWLFTELLLDGSCGTGPLVIWI